jgi:hypothetical protein
MESLTFTPYVIVRTRDSMALATVFNPTPVRYRHERLLNPRDIEEFSRVFHGHTAGISFFVLPARAHAASGR